MAGASYQILQSSPALQICCCGKLRGSPAHQCAATRAWVQCYRKCVPFSCAFPLHYAVVFTAGLNNGRMLEHKASELLMTSVNTL
jgi:hypothetical protein